ncbi:unnamed protein product [Phytophthora fragariaefolia]|uniref:Unnamed protein product n=1 Tax=Phytophthora fragariaefolia TaxID=1490495 RepID=A0A9W6U4I0_9STRA|nr:unnamed protein product [Phytophthora fragariaefolia]
MPGKSCCNTSPSKYRSSVSTCIDTLIAAMIQASSAPCRADTTESCRSNWQSTKQKRDTYQRYQKQLLLLSATTGREVYCCAFSHTVDPLVTLRLPSAIDVVSIDPTSETFPVKFALYQLNTLQLQLGRHDMVDDRIKLPISFEAGRWGRGARTLVAFVLRMTRVWNSVGVSASRWH